MAGSLADGRVIGVVLPSYRWRDRLLRFESTLCLFHASAPTVDTSPLFMRFPRAKRNGQQRINLFSGDLVAGLI